MGRRAVLAGILTGLLLAGLGAVIEGGPAAADGVPLVPGDVLAAVGNGQIRHFDPSGRLVDTIDTGATGESGGLVVDRDGALLAVDFAANSITKIDRSGTKRGPFGQPYDAHPETILRSVDGSIFVGLNDGSRQLLRLDPAGVVRQAFQPAVERRGVDWADLAADQCTLLYTSEGRLVKRFNVCRGAQLPDFATLPIAGNNRTAPTTSAYGLRILPHGEVLVASSAAVYRLSPAGKVVRTYSVPRTTQLVTLNLDPDLATFWVGDLPTGRLARVDLATGVVIATLETDPALSLSGVAVVGEVVAAQPLLRLDPVPAQVVGQTATVTGLLLNVVGPETTPVGFTVSGANPQEGAAKVERSGRVTLTYVGRKVGSDTVTVTARPATPPVMLTASTAAVTWAVAPTGAIAYTGATTGATGQPAHLAARLTDAGNLPVAGVPIVFAFEGGRGCTASTDAAGVASCAVTPRGGARTAVVTADFPGNGRLAPIRATGALAVVAAAFKGTPTGVAYTGPPSAIQGEATPLSARVVDTRSGRGIGGVPVTLAVNAVETCAAATDSGGTATCLLASQQPAGRYPVSVSAAGGPPGRLASSSTGELIVTVPAGPVAGGRAVVVASVGPVLAGVNVADTGRVVSEGATFTVRPLVGLPGPQLVLGVAEAAVTTSVGGSSARAASAGVELALGGTIPKIAVRGVEALSRSNCAEGSAGLVRVASVSIGPIALFASDLEVPANTGVTVPAVGGLPRVSLLLNEQVVVQGARENSVTVNAVHLVVPGVADITIGQAATDVRHCPPPAP